MSRSPWVGLTLTHLREVVVCHLAIVVLAVCALQTQDSSLGNNPFFLSSGSILYGTGYGNDNDNICLEICPQKNNL